jgi:hypothetical protein
MSDFWDNILRFPRFFISSTLGSVLVLVGPFFNLLQRPQTTAVLILIIGAMISFLALTLRAMLNLDID